MLRTLASLAHGIRALLRPRLDLAIENAALRQQLAVLKEKRRRPRLSNSDRIFWVTLRRYWARWESSLIVVRPATVTRWHRQGFKYFWRWKSRRRGRPRTQREVRVLIVRMATENSWRAPVHGENPSASPALSLGSHPPSIEVMQTTDLGKGNDLAHLGRLDSPRQGTVIAQRLMRS